MKGLIQRVSRASVSIDGCMVGAIDAGILLFLAIEAADTDDSAQRLLDRVIRYRIFPDEQGRMNRSLVDCGYDLLVVSQFTLAAGTHKGLRPSFSGGADPALGLQLYERFLDKARERLAELNAGRPNAMTLASGRFGADMQVSLINDGPVTFLLNV